LDYWKRPEHIYLGPDENMHNSMIQWIADLSRKYQYKPGGSFISSKPKYGINHKQYGVTSLGVNVYMQQVLKYLGIEPETDSFTIKMSGGPDGDVAGNQICNLYKYYRNTAHLLALTDGSGTILDPKGLDLEILHDLFQEGKPIKHYPPERLNDGGLLLDLTTKRMETEISQQTLCYRKKKGVLVEEWLSGNEMNQLFRNNVHQTKTDMFVPAGGRPRTLNEGNIGDFLDKEGNPTARAIVEGANLYFTSKAREVLEKKGTLIIKDSSANKAGVICSSFEVLCGLTLGDETFYQKREQIIKEILERLKNSALNEARLLLNTHKLTGEPLTTISDAISDRINTYTYQILDYLDPLELPENPENPLIRAFLNYCLPTLREEHQQQLLEEIPEHHKKAIIASHIAAQTVYQRGLSWEPNIVDILPIICEESLSREERETPANAVSS
jgi:glutamate dehydrogenase